MTSGHVVSRMSGGDPHLDGGCVGHLDLDLACLEQLRRLGLDVPGPRGWARHYQPLPHVRLARPLGRTAFTERL